MANTFFLPSVLFFLARVIIVIFPKKLVAPVRHRLSCSAGQVAARAPCRSVCQKAKATVPLGTQDRSLPWICGRTAPLAKRFPCWDACIATGDSANALPALAWGARTYAPWSVGSPTQGARLGPAAALPGQRQDFAGGPARRRKVLYSRPPLAAVPLAHALGHATDLASCHGEGHHRAAVQGLKQAAQTQMPYPDGKQRGAEQVFQCGKKWLRSHCLWETKHYLIYSSESVQIFSQQNTTTLMTTFFSSPSSCDTPWICQQRLQSQMN